MSIAAVVLAMTVVPLASGPVGVGTPIEAHPMPSGLETGNRRAFWSGGSHRWFVSSIVDGGYLYLRPQIAFGYGKPHWRFAQLETAATVSAGGVGQYGGLRVALPYVELRGGLRAQIPFARSFLPRQPAYDRFDLENESSPSARYLALDADVVATAPAYRGAVFALVGAHRLLSVPAEYDLYEEQLRVVVRPPWAFRARVGYTLRFGEQGAVRIGPVAEVVYVPARTATIFRAGLVATVVLSHHVEVLVTLVPTIVSPDRIGAAGGDFAQLGVRYRWATPEPPRE